MYYGDKRDAKVMIAKELVNHGWKIYGWKNDESDAMIDYFSPADWDGIAEKNGYVLCIDQNNTRYSGYEQKEYIGGNSEYKTNARIQKLEAMMNDTASTENEKASCAVLIEKEREKDASIEKWRVTETFPTFSFGNPRGTTWHIEKDGQIIAKGKGVFAVNDYDWENKEKTEKQQKAEKVEALINRFEKAIKDAGALKAEVIKVEKKVIKPIEKEDKTINLNDVLSFSYHGHYWVVTDIYTNSKGQSCITYELLGSEKRGYQRLNGMSVKRYYQTADRLNIGMEEGTVKVHTLQEVVEYQEKTVFKKTSRKQTVSNVPAIETTEDTQEETNEITNVSTEVTVTYNEEKQGIEIRFPSKPENNIIEQLKSYGFRWSKRGFWYAKQSDKTLSYTKELKTSDGFIETVTKPEDIQQEDREEIVDRFNVIYHDFEQYEEGEKEELQTMVDEKFEDVFSKFENINVTTTSSEDIEFCKEQEEIYMQTIDVYNTLKEQLQIIQELSDTHGNKYGKRFDSGIFHLQSTALDAGFSERDLEKNIKNIKNRFISNICHYFSTKYSITVDNEYILKKYEANVTYEDIVNEINEGLGGYNFIEKAEQEIKEKVRDIFKHGNKIVIKNNRLILDGNFSRFDSIWRVNRLGSKHSNVLTALSHFDNGSIKINQELSDKYCGYHNEKNDDNYVKYEPETLNKIKSIKFLKNGKMEIEFISNQIARKFAQDYCGHKKQSA
ncbi:hypothetical protein [Paenibacillus polymyxa]|uniref:hypothetical protein n=1 Tax=Paenibacillus polymyxa TaxID=1406 RepID=UPI002AB3F9AE|nr:hypothetical protein [Paenibacillus polymyxa]MDY8021231.1 hypothetical protein [Paenibacillus polymyxa]